MIHSRTALSKRMTPRYWFLFLVLMFEPIMAPAQNTNWLDGLISAYQTKSTRSLDSLLQIWKKDSDRSLANRPAKRSEIEEEGYRVYQAFYNPLKLGLIEKFEWKSDHYQPYPYIIVQTDLTIQMVKRFYSEMDIFNSHISYTNFDSILAQNRIKEIPLNEFRPSLSFPDKTVLFLLPSYDSSLTKFLDAENVAHLLNEDQNREEKINRWQFLRQRIGIELGHWKGWHLKTHPDVGRIEFNLTADSAMVHFKLIYQWGDALLVKERDQWRLNYARAPIIE